MVLDLEDAVPPAAKADGPRRPSARAAGELAGVVPVCVRVNPPGTPWFADDVAALPAGLAAVVVPKLDSADQVATVADASATGPSWPASRPCGASPTPARCSLPRWRPCYFGAEDYVADLGGVRTPGNAEVAWARAAVAVAARLAGVPALDMVTIDFHDGDRFTAEAARGPGARLRRQDVHPPGAGRPSPARRSAPRPTRSTRPVACWRPSRRRGATTIAFEGQMVDEVVAARARAVLAAAAED